ncbi:MAG: hypothetical protein Q7S57_06250 [bacterium]|nr:hypothetical protein [bacterium]
MNLNRTSGLAFGFGIGIVIAITIFGISWITKRSSDTLKTQAFQPTANTQTQTVPTQPPPAVVSSAPQTNQDTLVNRMAPQTDKVVEDIQSSLQELYGPKN